MGKQRLIAVTDTQRDALVRLRDSAPKAYVRERAAAILKIADGTPAAVVAREGLLRPRNADTIYEWLDRFEKQGIKGLYIEPGRGRKPSALPARRQPTSDPKGNSRRTKVTVTEHPRRVLAALDASGGPRLTGPRSG
ncbi:MAG: helix-turn-helix domain-containing protein [Chloroflexota bacterium]|nr:MAG: helix-turn-helix domain-containing protein [Chloroflexota bacterium]